MAEVIRTMLSKQLNRCANGAGACKPISGTAFLSAAIRQRRAGYVAIATELNIEQDAMRAFCVAKGTLPVDQLHALTNFLFDGVVQYNHALNTCSLAPVPATTGVNNATGQIPNQSRHDDARRRPPSQPRNSRNMRATTAGNRIA